MSRGKAIAVARALLLAIIAAAATVSSAHSQLTFQGRALQQQNESNVANQLSENTTTSFADVAEDVSAFVLVSSARNQLPSRINPQPNAIWNIPVANASLELDDGPTYSNNFKIDNRLTWQAGTTRLNVSIGLGYLQAVLTPQFPAQLWAVLYTPACSSSMDTSLRSMYQQDPTEGNTTAVMAPLYFNVSNYANASVTVPFLVDYDSAQSVVFFQTNGNPVACVNLRPPFPDFPDEWVATVEANIINKGYTFAMREYYSATRNNVRLDLHSNGTDTVLFQDYNASKITIVRGANSTYPHGVCSARDMNANFSSFATDSNNSLLSTSEFLRFTVNGTSATYVPGHFSVRGIECEVWMQNMTGTNYSFNTYFYFPVSQWLVAREGYHRLLAMISVNGTRNSSGSLNFTEHEYHFVNMRPDITTDEIFDPCIVAPKGENCNCTAADLSTLARTPGINVASADGEAVIDPSFAGCFNAANASELAGSASSCSCPSGFTHNQGGPYTLMFFFGLLAGVILSVLGNYLWNYFSSRTHKGHERFQDAPTSFIRG
jgi:hypothetical protein